MYDIRELYKKNGGVVTREVNELFAWNGIEFKSVTFYIVEPQYVSWLEDVLNLICDNAKVLH